MSIEALPYELLVKVFSYLGCNSLRHLSLVNRRWNQVIGQMATLKISNCVYNYESLTSDGICIPFEVLCGSSREYRKFHCSMLYMDFQMMSETLGTVLKYCHQRWSMNELCLVSHYDQFSIFLKNHMHLLNEVVRADISVDDYFSTNCRVEGGVPNDMHFVLPMEKLQRLDLDYTSCLFCSLSFNAPKLEFLTVARSITQDDFYLALHNSTKLRSVLIHGNAYPVELQSISPQEYETTMLEIKDCSKATTVRVIFGNLQTIVLTSVTITPTDELLECLNLTKLQLLDVELQKPLKIRVPQLHTLICDIQALQSLHLQDAMKAELLVLDLTERQEICAHYETVRTFPGVLSRFRRLYLLPWLIASDLKLSWLWRCLSEITELKLEAYYSAGYFHRIRNIWKHFPQLKSLRLLRVELPYNFNFLPVNVQSVTIEDSLTDGGIIEFPPSVERVWVKKLWDQTEDDGSSSWMILLPLNRYSPLESEILQVRDFSHKMVSRTYYSTKDCHDVENFNPLPCRNDLFALRFRVEFGFTK